MDFMAVTNYINFDGIPVFSRGNGYCRSEKVDDDHDCGLVCYRGMLDVGR
jgi:hypothetical protein